MVFQRPAPASHRHGSGTPLPAVGSLQAQMQRFSMAGVSAEASKSHSWFASAQLGRS